MHFFLISRSDYIRQRSYAWEEEEEDASDEVSAVSEGEGDVLEGLHILPGLQLRGRGRGRARGRGRGRGRGLGRGRRGRRGRGSVGGRQRDEEEVPALSDLQAHTAVLADTGAGQEEVEASLQALLRLEVNTQFTGYWTC